MIVANVLKSLLSFSMMAVLLAYSTIPAAGQRHENKRPVTSQTAPDGDTVQVVDGHMYVPRPWEPVNPEPLNFSQLLAPQITPVAGTWTSIGPGPLNSSGSNGNVSGRITGIAAHPTDPNTIYIATAGGGVWKTTNGGTTWAPMTEGQQTLSMGCIALAPTNPNHVYAGTGEANNSLDSNFGRGILVSANAGASWTLSTGPGGTFNTFRLSCSKIAVDPTNENIAYAAISPRGHNGIFTFNTTGIFKTTDGGATWANVTAANGKEPTYPWSDVVVDPNTPTTVYASVGYDGGIGTNAIYKSTDSGATWTQLAAANAPVGTSFGRFSLAISRSLSANVLYAAATSPSSGALSRMVRSDDGGVSFSLLTTPNYMGGQGWYDQWLADDQTNSANAYASGAASSNSILRTTTSGSAWTAINAGASTSPHADHHAAAFDASGRLLDGDDGGIYRLDDPAGVVWTNINGNLGSIQFQGIGLHPTNAQIAIGGSQDNGTEVYSGSATWTETDGGDGGYAKFSPTNGNVAYHQIPVLSFGSNFFRVSTNGGSTWTTRTTSLTADQTTQQFYAPFVVDPGNGDRVLYGTQNVWETTNEGTTWTQLSTVGTAGWNPSGFYVNAIGLAPSSVNTIYAAAHNGGFGNTSLFVTTDHGATWTAKPQPTGLVQDIQVDPTTPTTAYIAMASFTGAGNVYKTTDGGGTWTDISGNLAKVTACTCAIPVWSIQLDVTNNKIYIGADDGVYVSGNGGANWSRFGVGLPNGQVYQIELNKTLNLLGAAIHGRGMWEIVTPSAVTQQIAFSASNFNIAEEGGHVDVNVVRTGDTSGAATVDYTTFNEAPGAGHASQTSDYEVATGTLTFASGETSKTFSVLIADDKFAEGNETLGITLTSPTGTGVGLGPVSTAEVTIVDNDSGTPTTNPYDDPRFFVRQQYLDFLNREPDQSGWDFWTNTVTECGADTACTEVHRINVSAAFFLSNEFQNTGYLAYVNHRSAFGASASGGPAPVLYNTFVHDVQELGKGYIFTDPNGAQVLETNKVAYFNEFVARPDFVAKYPSTLTNQQFVDNLLTTASLPTTGAFRDSLFNGLSGGSLTRATVLRTIAESTAIQTRELNAGFVTMEYFGYLRRDPDTSGFNFWLTKLNAFNGNYIQAEMVKAFIESTEDRQRFGTP